MRSSWATWMAPVLFYWHQLPYYTSASRQEVLITVLLTYRTRAHGYLVSAATTSVRMLPKRATHEGNFGKQQYILTDQHRPDRRDPPVWRLPICRNGKIPNLKFQDPISTLYATLDNYSALKKQQRKQQQKQQPLQQQQRYSVAKCSP